MPRGVGRTRPGGPGENGRRMQGSLDGVSVHRRPGPSLFSLAPAVLALTLSSGAGACSYAVVFPFDISSPLSLLSFSLSLSRQVPMLRVA